MALLLALGGALACAPPRVTQPVAFDHKLHAAKDIDCTYCHEHVENTPYATLPSNGVCLGCHDKALGKSAAEASFLALAAKGPVPWVQVNRLPGHVYFSHRAHVTFGEISCTECHGDMAQRSEPVTRPQLTHLTMSGCVQCHEKKKARTDCLTCHQ